MKQIFILARHTFKELVRRKDFYVLLFLFLALAIFFYKETFFGVKDLSRYLKDIGFSLITLFSMIIAVTFSAKQIPSEIESKTVYPTLAKPVSRTHFVLGKFLGSLFISTIAFTAFYLLYLALILAKGEGAGFALIAEGWLFSVYSLALLSSFAILLSLFFTISANVTIVFVSYFFIYWYNGVLKDLLLSSSREMSYIYGILYYILPHFEFYDTRIRLVHLWDPLPLRVVFAVSAYTFLYIGLIIWAATAVFKRKNL